MALMISWVMPVNPSHPYLENDPAPSFAPTICAFHLGFSLVLQRRIMEGSPEGGAVPGVRAAGPLAAQLLRLQQSQHFLKPRLFPGQRPRSTSASLNI